MLFSKQFQEHVEDLEEQLHALASQRDSQVLDLGKCKDKIEHDSAAIYNLQSALEQMQKGEIIFISIFLIKIFCFRSLTTLINSFLLSFEQISDTQRFRPPCLCTGNIFPP